MGFWGRCLAYVSMLVTFMIVFVAAGSACAAFIYGKQDVAEYSAPALRLLQVFMQAGVFMLPAAIFCLIFRPGNPRQRLGLGHIPSARQALICVCIMAAAQPLVGFLNEINLRMQLPDCMAAVESWMRSSQESADSITRKLLDSPSWGTLAANILVMAAMPAVGEELTFRMALQAGIISDATRIPKLWAAVIAAAIFSAIHLQFFGFAPRFALGLFLGLMLIETRGILCPMIAHFANNAIAIAWAFVEASEISIDIPAFADGPAAAAASAIACAGLFALLRRSEKKMSK